eukprot:CFRG5189T1
MLGDDAFPVMNIPDVGSSPLSSVEELTRETNANGIVSRKVPKLSVDKDTNGGQRRSDRASRARRVLKSAPVPTLTSSPTIISTSPQGLTTSSTDEASAITLSDSSRLVERIDCKDDCESVRTDEVNVDVQNYTDVQLLESDLVNETAECGTIQTLKDTVSRAVSTSASITKSGGNKTSGESGRKPVSWTINENRLFFESLMKVGKDFEKLRVPTRSQEQLRHYYYRNLKMIHKWLGDEYKPRSGADERFQLKCLWYLQKTLNAPNDSLAASYNYTHLFGPRLVALYTVGKTEYSKLGKVKKLSCKRDKYYDINGLPIPRYTQCHHPEHTYISTHSGSSNTHSGKNTAVPCAGKQTKTYTTTENSVKTVRSGVSSTVNSTSRSKSVQSKPVSYLENGVNKNVGVENGTFLNRSESKLKSKSGSDGSEACARKMSASEGKDSRAKLPSDENVGATEGVSACERKSIPKFASNGSVGNAEGVTCGGNDGSLLSGPPATKTITSVPMPQTLLMRLGTKRKGNDRILPTRRPSRTVNTLSAIRAKKDVMEAKVGVPEKSFVAGEIHSLAPTLKTKRKISCVDDENDCKTTKKNMTLGGEPKKSNAKRVQKRKKKADVVPTFPVKPKPLMVRHMPYPYHKPVQPVGQILQAIGHAPPSGRVLPAEQILQHTGEISQSPGESLQPLTNTLENRQLQNITERTDSCLQAKANVILQSDKTTEQPSLPTRSSHATTITNPDVGTSGGHSDEEVSVGVTVEDRERGDDIYTLSKLDGMEQGVRMNADARESESVDMGATAGAMWNEASNGQNDKSKKFGMQLDTHHPHSSSNTDEAHRNWNIARASDTRTNMFDGRSSTLVNECENENYSMEEEILTAEEKRQLSITMRKLSNPAEAKILSIAMKKLSNRKNQRLLSIQSHAHTKACVNLCPNSPVLSPTHPHTGPMYQTEASKQALAGSTARQAQDVKYLGRTIDHQSNTFMPTQTMHKDIEFDYRTQTQPQPFPRSNTHSKEQTKTESSAFIISDSVIQPDLHLQLARQSSPSMADAHPKPHPLSHLNTNSEQVKRYGDMQTNDSPNQHPPAFTKKSHTFTNVQAPNNRVDTQTLEHAHSQTQSHSQKSTRSGPSSPTRGVPLEHRTRSFDALVNTALQLESVSMHVGSSGMQSVPPQQALEHSQTLHEKSHPRGVHLEPQVGPPRQNEYFLNVSSQAHSQRLEQSSHTSHIESAPLQPLKQPNDSQARSLLSESRNCSQQHSSLQRPSQLHDQSQSNGQLQQHEQSQPLHAPNPPTLQPLSQSQPDSQVQWLSGRRKRRVTPIPLNVNSNVDVSTSAVAGAGMALNQDMSMHDAYPLAQANAQTQLSHPHNNRNKQNPYKFEIHAHFDRTSTSTSPYNSLVGLAGGINMNLGTNMAMSRTNMPLRYDADGAHGSMESMAQNTREKEMTRSSSLDSNLGLVDNAVGRANESVGGRVNGGCDNADVGVALLSPLHLRSLPSDDTETDFNCTYSNAITGDTKQLASHTPLNTNDQAYINNYSGYSTDTSTSSYPIARTHPSSVKHKNINSSAGSGTNLHPHTSVNSNVNITNTAENRWSDSWSGPVRVDLVPACAQDRISLGRMNMNPNISINVKKGTKQVIKILDHLEKKWFGGFHNQTHNITLWVPFYTDNAPDTKNEMKMDTEVSANTGVADNLNASAGSNDGMDENNVASSSKRRSGNFHLSKLQTEQQAHTYVKESVSKSIDNSINVGLNVDVHNQNKNELTNLQCSNMYKNVNMKRGMDMLDSDASGNPGYGLRFEHGAGTRTRTVTSEYVRSNVHNSKAIDDVKQLDAGDLFSEGNGLHMADDFVLPITNDRHQSVLVSSKSETSDISSLENKPTAAPKPVLKPPTPWDGDDTMGYSCDGFGSSVFLSGEGRGEQSNSTHLNARNSLAYNTCSRSNFNFPRSHTHAHPPSRTYSNSNLDAIRNLHDSSSIGPWQSQTRQDVSGKELRIMYERDVLDNADDVCMAVQMARNQGVSEGQADVHECDDPVECASASKSEPSSKGYTSTMVHNIGSSEYNVRDNARIAAGSPLSSSISASTGSKLMPEQIGERMVLDGDTSTSSAVYDISRTELGTKTNIGMIERHGNQITFTQPVRPTCSGNPEHTRA